MSSRQNRARKLLEQGLQYHRSGDLAAAENAYLGALKADPRNPDALNLRGVIALATGRIPLAATLFREATALQPSHEGFWANLGYAQFELKNYAESESAYRRALRLAPHNADFTTGVANALAAGGNADEARTLFQSLADRLPNHAGAWFGLAKLAESAGDANQALELYRRTLQAEPNHGNAHLNAGVVLQSLNRLDEAEQSYRHAMRCGAQRDIAFINLTSVLTALGKFEEAAQIAQAGIVEFPQCADLHRMLSAAFVQQGRLNDALAPLQQALALDADNVKLQMTYGAIQFEAGFPDEGIATLEKLLADHARDAEIAHGVGITLLTAGRIDEGWPHFIHREIRRTKLEKRPWLAADLPASLQGRWVRLYREQGLGDELFFLRYAPVLKALGAQVSYITNPKLTTMLQRVACIDLLIEEQAGTADDPPSDLADTSIINLLVGDLPRALHRSHNAYCQTLPAPLALTALPEKITALRDRLAALGPPPYLALTWRGGIAPHEQKGSWWTLFKNIRIDALGRALAGLPHTLLAVQRNPLPGEIEQLSRAAGNPVHDVCDVNDDLEGMLALMALVDDYAGASNTNMHLRAGLNRGARVLVPRPSEWRWMAYGEASPWFPGFRVYRQEIDSTWHAALDRLRADLHAAPAPAAE